MLHVATGDTIFGYATIANPEIRLLFEDEMDILDLRSDNVIPPIPPLFPFCFVILYNTSTSCYFHPHKISPINYSSNGFTAEFAISLEIEK